MPLSKSEVRAAFREAGARRFAHVPPESEIEYTFSEDFCRRMDALVEEEHRGSWRLLSQQRRRVLVVAAILVTALLLASCTPTLREAISDFVVSIYERFVGYGTSTETHEEIETIYALDPIPEGFEFVSQTQHSPYYIETVYEDKQGVTLIIMQATSASLTGSVDNENSQTTILPGTEVSALIYSSKTSSTACWICDDYYMKLFFSAQLTDHEIIGLISTISPIK